MTNLKTVDTYLKKTLARVNKKIDVLKEDLKENNIKEQDLVDMYANERKINDAIYKLHAIERNLEQSMSLMKELGY